MEPDPPARPATAEAHQSKILAFTRKAVVDLAIVVAVGLVGVSILSDVWSSAYSIGPIEVSEGFAHDLEDRDSIAMALKLEVGRLVKEAQTGVAVKPDAPSASEPELAVAGTKIPLRYVAGLARKALRLPYVSLTGQLLPAEAGPAEPVDPEEQACRLEPGDVGDAPGKPMRLVLSLADSATGPLFDCTGPFPAILHRGAWAVLKAVDPFAAATLLSKKVDPSSRDQRRALLLIETGLASAKAEDMPRWFQRIVPIWPDRVPRGYLSLGNLYLHIDDQDRAQEAFAKAAAEAAARNPLHRRSAAALDGQSIVALNRTQKDRTIYLSASFDTARLRACDARRLDPSFDAASYHLAQSEDYRARYYFLPGTKDADACHAGAIADNACALYGSLLKQHPDFTVAYVQQGTLMLQRLNHLMASRQDGCRPLSEADRAARETDFARFADASFATAVLLDQKSNADVWLQWGILGFSLYHDPISPADAAKEARSRRIDQALSRYSYARTLAPRDYYIRFRIAEALWARAAIDPAHRDRDRRDALAAACEAGARVDDAQRQTLKDLLAEDGIDAGACAKNAPEVRLDDRDLPDPIAIDVKEALDCPEVHSADAGGLESEAAICMRPPADVAP